MGWTYSPSWTLKTLIAERKTGWTNTGKDGIIVTSTCLKSCFRGNPAFAGTLWGVWEQTFQNPDGSEAKPPERFITCDLLRCTSYQGVREWGYKDMEESSGPYYYNCPESYLKMAPVANAEWRRGVAEYHQRRREKRARKKQEIRTVNVGY